MPKKTAQLIDGKALAERILLELKGQVNQLNRPPGLAVILIGDDQASHLYIKNKKKAAEKVGIEFHDYLCGKKCHPDITEEEILEMIDFLNKDPKIDGIIVQLPIPKKINTEKIINRISPQKDVDGFHSENQEKFMKGKARLIPPLIGAINIALKTTNEELKNKQAVIVAKNPVFSKPLEKELETKGLITKIVKPEPGFEKETKKADVLIVIVGQKYLIKKSMVKPDAIVIDIGTNLIGSKKPSTSSEYSKASGQNEKKEVLGKWAGDVDPEVSEVASWLTPVPGGIGPLTVACLLKNTYLLAK